MYPINFLLQDIFIMVANILYNVAPIIIGISPNGIVNINIRIKSIFFLISNFKE